MIVVSKLLRAYAGQKFLAPSSFLWENEALHKLLVSKSLENVNINFSTLIQIYLTTTNFGKPSVLTICNGMSHHQKLC
jgi:hypothetical protein